MIDLILFQHKFHSDSEIEMSNNYFESIVGDVEEWCWLDVQNWAKLCGFDDEIVLDNIHRYKIDGHCMLTYGIPATELGVNDETLYDLRMQELAIRDATEKSNNKKRKNVYVIGDEEEEEAEELAKKRMVMTIIEESSESEASEEGEEEDDYGEVKRTEESDDSDVELLEVKAPHH